MSSGLRNGESQGIWYAVNPYVYFLTLDRYLTVTGDYGFLAESINGTTVLDHLEAFALDWKRLVRKYDKLADIGGQSWNKLEAPPNYVHTVASLNAANVWTMRRPANIRHAASIMTGRHSFE